MRVLILHAYSAANRGDGLLVEETVKLVREAFENPSITIAASYPDSFGYLGLSTVDTQPTRRGYRREYLKTLRSIDGFDLVVGVGGGYLRGGYFVEFLKCAAVHGPQLLAAARTSAPTLYLPQSVGPFRLGSRPLFRMALSRLAQLNLRDDRSIEEVGAPDATRMPDLALLRPDFVPLHSATVEPMPVLSVRKIRGLLPVGLTELSSLLSPFDGYVQSAVGSNNDTAAVLACDPQSLLSEEQLLHSGTPRVVVAVRLHAALMALNAGNFVIHLAYERKGFGAFQDLGLDEFVHNVNSFDPQAVTEQTRQLLESPARRKSYAVAVASARTRFAGQRTSLVSRMRALGTISPSDIIKK